jgi:hypothetical protein
MDEYKEYMALIYINLHAMQFMQSSELNNHAFTSKLYVLDPLSVIVKLSILSNKPIGTKITIQQNAIEFNDYSIYQGIYRLFYGYNKTDLHYLHNPIYLACERFLSTDTHELFVSAQLGIKKLIDTYKQSSLITVCLSYYDSIISGFMLQMEKHQNKKVIKMSTGHNDSMTSMYTPDLLESLTSMWTEPRLQIILSLNSFLSRDDATGANEDVQSLERIMEGIDKEARNIILTI